MIYICSPNNQKTYRGVEQLVARRAHNPKVAGSSPVPATRKDKTLSLSFLFPEKWGNLGATN